MCKSVTFEMLPRCYTLHTVYLVNVSSVASRQTQQAVLKRCLSRNGFNSHLVFKTRTCRLGGLLVPRLTTPTDSVNNKQGAFHCGELTLIKGEDRRRDGGRVALPLSTRWRPF